ncbi:hypothetical protein OH77DRAFT_1410980 [Trametes cingulata]|nr:hypothetical protein OH77DRAFT_1410980 [Trametes cingulata]
MHNLFLGELRHHCRDVWGINVKDGSRDTQKVKPHTPEEQQKWLNNLINALRKGSLNKVLQPRKGYLVALAELNGVVPLSKKFTKTEYAQALLRWVRSEDALASIKVPPVLDRATEDFHLAENEYDISRFRVLDDATIHRLREDIAATHFPSWMERPPRNFGSPSHGKLKADQWRTACTVSMVITLTRLWGQKPASSRERVLLESFLHLVCAVNLAARRSMSNSRASRFDYHISRYLQSLRTLFNHELVPNHHLSLHLKFCLELFGPVHAWWSFPFERFIGLLQRLNMNHKSSQMPGTFMKYFYIGSNVRWLMADTEWPEDEVYKQMVQRYNEAFRDSAKGTRRGDFDLFQEHHANGSVAYDPHKESALPRGVYDALLARINGLSGNVAPKFASVFDDFAEGVPRLHTKGQYISSWDHRGVTYSTKGAQLRNSFVYFNHEPSAATPVFPKAGQIVDIFLHARTEKNRHIEEPFFVIEEYSPLSAAHAEQDPFRRYPDLQTRLFYNQFQPVKSVVMAQQIRSHFAAFAYIPDDIATECVVALSLDRVSGASAAFILLTFDISFAVITHEAIYILHCTASYLIISTLMRESDVT